MDIGMVCKIEVMTKKGLRDVVGLHLGQREKDDLWLLLRYEVDSPINEVDVVGKSETRKMVYSAINAGNCVVTYGNAIKFVIGRVHEMDKVCKDIFESNRCGLLEAFRRESTQDNFYTRFTAPKGALVVGGCTHKL